MHHRRIASFLVGMWIAGSLLMLYISAQNVLSVDQILHTPTLTGSTVIEKMGSENARMLMNWQAAEQNRAFIPRWEIVQIALAIILAAVLFLGTHTSRLLLLACGIMVLLLGFMHFVLTPEITWVGRQLDFIPSPGASRSRFWLLQLVYTGLEVLKLLLCSAIAGYLFLFRTPRTKHSSSSERGAETSSRTIIGQLQ